MCCEETAEYSVCDGWPNGDVSGRKLQRLARSSRRGTWALAFILKISSNYWKRELKLKPQIWSSWDANMHINNRLKTETECAAEMAPTVRHFCCTAGEMLFCRCCEVRRHDYAGRRGGRQELDGWHVHSVPLQWGWCTDVGGRAGAADGDEHIRLCCRKRPQKPPCRQQLNRKHSGPAARRLIRGILCWFVTVNCTGSSGCTGCDFFYYLADTG